jgi:hypothetical protein
MSALRNSLRFSVLHDVHKPCGLSLGVRQSHLICLFMLNSCIIQYWHTTKADNVKFFEDLKAEGNRLKLKLGVYTSASQWEPIMGMLYLLRAPPAPVFGAWLLKVKATPADFLSTVRSGLSFVSCSQAPRTPARTCLSGTLTTTTRRASATLPRSAAGAR